MADPDAPPKNSNRYQRLIAGIFLDHWIEGVEAFEFDRSEIEDKAALLAIKLPKNIGDVPYSFRYRAELPADILATQPKGLEWIIDGAGRARYRFRLVKANRILPRADMASSTFPTPRQRSFAGMHWTTNRHFWLSSVTTG